MSLILRISVSLLTLFFTCSLAGHWNLELSPESVCTVPFAGASFGVWEHSVTRGRYYVQPLAILKPDSAKTSRNPATNKWEMSFDIIMWSEEAQEAVFLFIKKNIRSSVRLENISLLPIEKLRLDWNSEFYPNTEKYLLDDHWKFITNLQRLVMFKFVCDTAKNCKELEASMKDNPAFFDPLHIQYVIDGEKTLSRTVQIETMFVSKGRLFSKLSNDLNGKQYTYLNSSDMNDLLKESKARILAHVRRDKGYEFTGDDVPLKDFLSKEMEIGTVNSANFDAMAWGSVFWDPDWARPDKVIHELNKILDESEKESRHINYTDTKRSGRFSTSAHVGGFYKAIGLEVGMSVAGQRSGAKKVLKTDFIRRAQKNFDYVLWDGEKFYIKPMVLHRVNFPKFLENREMDLTNVLVGDYRSLHNQKVLNRVNANDQTAILTTELVQSRLESALAEEFRFLSRKVNANAQEIRDQREECTNELHVLESNTASKFTMMEDKQDSHKIFIRRLHKVLQRLSNQVFEIKETGKNERLVNGVFSDSRILQCQFHAIKFRRNGEIQAAKAEEGDRACGHFRKTLDVLQPGRDEREYQFKKHVWHDE